MSLTIKIQCDRVFLDDKGMPVGRCPETISVAGQDALALHDLNDYARERNWMTAPDAESHRCPIHSR